MQSQTEHTTFMFSSAFHLSNVIYAGDQEMWEKSLQDPAEYARWVFMRKSGGVSDEVWKALHGTPQLLNNYDLVYQDRGTEVYKRKEEGKGRGKIKWLRLGVFRTLKEILFVGR